MSEDFQFHRGYTGKNFSREAMARQMRGGASLILVILVVTFVVMIMAFVFVYLRDGISAATDPTFLLIMLGIALFSVALFGFILWNLRRRESMYREGQIVPGTITSASTRDRNGYNLLTITYQFANPSGATISGKAQGLWSKTMPVPGEGTRLDVLYHTDRLHVPI